MKIALLSFVSQFVFGKFKSSNSTSLESQISILNIKIKRNTSFENFFHLSKVPMIATNLHGEITYSNAAGKNLLHKILSKTATSPLHLLQGIEPEAVNKINSQWETLKKGECIQWEATYRNIQDHSHIILWESSPDLETQLIYHVGHDITEIREHEKRILNASKLISITQIAAGIAHEINNPLTVIRGRVELINRILAKETPDINKIKNYLQNTDEMVSRAASIIDALRIFTLSSTSHDLSSGHLEESWILPLIEKSFNLFKERFSKRKIKVKINLIGDDFKVYCRPREIMHILNILIANSVEAIQKMDDPWISCTIIKENENTKIIFKDSGRGISQNLSTKIMEPFYSTKPQGSGLGLSIAKGLIVSHGGSIFFDPSETNTTFIIQFPHSKKQNGIEVIKKGA